MNPVNVTDSIDVLIVGAGPAGSAAAQMLARHGVRVVVWESAIGHEWKVGETLPPASRPLLEQLGVWDKLSADGHLPSYGNVSAWGTSTLAATDFIFHAGGHGWQIDRRQFDRRLATAACEAGAVIYYSTQYLEAQEAAPGWLVRGLCNGNPMCLTARWIIDASGRKSVVSRTFGAKRRAADKLVGVYAVQSANLPSGPCDVDSRTLVEAVPDGWWFSILTPQGTRTVTLLSDGDLLKRQNTHDASWFRHKMLATVHVQQVLQRYGYQLNDAPTTVSACGARTIPCGACGWLAIGDAACSFDPLSGRGILHCIQSGIDAAQAISSDLAGMPKAIQRYHATIEATWSAYRRNRLAYYRQEPRWSDRVFWKRRQTTTEPISVGDITDSVSDVHFTL
jgi:flavin-dependent dehydrogenase